jgi:hypothetical protein
LIGSPRVSEESKKYLAKHAKFAKEEKKYLAETRRQREGKI